MSLHATGCGNLMRPPLVQIAPNLVAATFEIMKVIPAMGIVEAAIGDGRVREKTMLLETSSGTMALALALVARSVGQPCAIVTDVQTDEVVLGRLKGLGAEVHVTSDVDHPKGLQGARLEIMNEVLRQNPDSYWTRQYENPWNPNSYGRFAKYLVDAIGPIDALIGPVGTGGSMCGTSRALRRVFPHMTAVGVDTHGSVTFGLPPGNRDYGGLGSAIHFRNVDHTVFDEVHHVNGAEAFRAIRELANRCLFQGPTSGAAYLAAMDYAGRNPERQCVVIMPDAGYRYLATAHSDDWVRQEGQWLDALPTEPWQASRPSEVIATWTRMQWNRRTLEEALSS